MRILGVKGRKCNGTTILKRIECKGEFTKIATSYRDRDVLVCNKAGDAPLLLARSGRQTDFKVGDVAYDISSP